MKHLRTAGLSLLAAILLVGAAVYFLYPHLPRTADLDHVRETAKPDLEQQLESRGFQLGQPIFVRIFKESRELEVWVKNSDRFAHFKTYPICNYSGALGPKLKEGDRQSPEGFYFVGKSQLNPQSSYHLSFNLGFPNAYDRAHDRTGSYLMVHGNCVSVGCYAMTDEGIEEIYLLAEAALNKGQPFFRVQAFPFRMTARNMQRHARSDWIGFWRNLQEGYDAFERHRIPPDVKVVGRKYHFESDA